MNKTNEIILHLKFDGEGLKREVEIMLEAIGKLDNCDPTYDIYDGILIIKGEEHCWSIKLDEYIVRKE